MEMVENPVLGTSAKASGDVEQALAALQSVSDPQTAEAMERLMDAKVAELRAELAQGDGDIKSVVARLTEAPTNFHQDIVYFAALPPEDQDASWSRLAILGGVMMVLSQCVVVAGLAMSTNEMSCESSDGCPQRGTYCHVGESDSCWYCGSSTPLPTETDPATGGTMNKADAERHGLPRFVGVNATLVTEACSDPLAFSLNGWAGPASIASGCETCVAAEWHTARDLHGAELITVGVDTETAESHRAANVSSMGSVDWAALIFASLIVALTVVGEIKDIKLVTLAIRHAGDKLSSRWRFALTAIGVVRRWVFLPTLVMSVPMLAVYQGGDALSIVSEIKYSSNSACCSSLLIRVLVLAVLQRSGSTLPL
jgi:hypothetical protein